MKKKRVSSPKGKSVDFIFLFSVLLLIVLGMIMMYSSSWPEALKEFNDTGYFVKRQLKFAAAGFLSMAVFSFVPYKRYTLILLLLAYLFALLLNFLTFTSLGVEFLGSRRWLNLGFLFMPSDILKLASVAYLSKVLVSQKKRIGTLGVTVRVAFITFTSFFIVAKQKDLGTSMVIAATLGGLLLIGGVKIRYFVAGATGVVGFFFYYVYSSAERFRRLMMFQDPFQDKLGEGMQAVRALYAMGSGGVRGLGLGKSILKFGYLPECHNDFIFAIIGEELGLVGSMIFIFLLMSIVLRGFYISKSVKDPFGKYLAAGFSLLIMIQSSVHILVNQSAIPTTGITLPFVSQGGTSLLVFMTAVGIVLNVSRYAETKGEGE